MEKVWARLKILPVFVALTLLLTCACVFAAPKDDARAEVDAAFKAMEGITNGNLLVSCLLDTALFDADTKVDMSFFSADKGDLSIKGVATLASGQGKEATTDEYPFYIKGDEKQCVIYYQKKGQWYKDETNLDEEKNKKEEKQEEKLSPKDEQELKKLSDKLIKSVTRGGSTADTQDYVVTVDGKVLGTMAKLSVRLAPQDKLKEKNADDVLTPENLKIFEKMEDFSGTVSVDKTTGMVKKITVDLSRPMISIANGVIDSQKSIDASAKSAFKDIVAGSKVNIEVGGGEYNKVGPITIPEDIVKNAKPAPKDEKETASNEKKAE